VIVVVFDNMELCVRIRRRKKKWSNSFFVDLSSMKKAVKTASMSSGVLWPPSEEKKEESMNEQREEYVAEATNNEGKKKRKSRVSIRLTCHILPLTVVCYHLLKWTNTMTSIEAVSISCITERIKLIPMIRKKQSDLIQIIQRVSESS
jgi:hypothetical protein